GAAMGQGVVWYTGQFYSMSFMKTVMMLDSNQADLILGIALLCGTPFFVVFGRLSDKVGRKWVMLIGMLLALLTYRPIYQAMYSLGDLENKTEIYENRTEETLPGNAETEENETHLLTRHFTDGSKITTAQIIHN